MRGRGNAHRGYVARGEQEEEKSYDRGDWHQLDQYGFVVRKVGDQLGPEVFLLDSAATSHMVDEMVFLQEEQQVDIDVKGVAAAKATAVGKLIVDGIRFEGVLKVRYLDWGLISFQKVFCTAKDVISSLMLRRVGEK
jgi:hypothetical protein